MKHLPIYLLYLSLTLHARAYSEEELVTWHTEAVTLMRADADYIETYKLSERTAVVAYLASAGYALKDAEPEIYNLGVQGINTATLMSADGLVCPPWEVLLTTVLGGIGAPVPIVYETELYGLVVRNHSAGRILMSRLTGVEGITSSLSSLKLKE